MTVIIWCSFPEKLWRSLLLKARLLAWNSPNTVWRPGSARTRWGSQNAPQTPSRNKGGLLLRGRGREGTGKGKGKGRGPCSKVLGGIDAPECPGEYVQGKCPVPRADCQKQLVETVAVPCGQSVRASCDRRTYSTAVFLSLQHHFNSHFRQLWPKFAIITKASVQRIRGWQMWRVFL